MNRKIIFKLVAAVFATVGIALAQRPAQDDSLKEQPRVLKANEHGIGHLMPDVSLKDTQGRELKWSDLGNKKALVIAMFGATCPISNKFGPELARLEKEYAAKQAAFLFVAPVAGESAEDIAKFVDAFHLTSPVVKDSAGTLAKRLGATTTTEVFILDSTRTLVYRGAVNNQYGLGYSKSAPTKTYLRDALDAVLRGQTPVIAATTAPGCALDLPKTENAVAKSTVTYNRDISRIVQNNCATCHHTGGLGPFSLETFADVTKHAGEMKKQLTRGTMPPWFAAKLDGEKESPWANDCSLNAQDKANLLAWLASSDRPMGDAKDAPLPRAFPAEWTIGKPDYIAQLPKPVAIKAEGTMPYQFINVENTLAEDRWVQAYEIIPTDRSVVHHVIVHLREKGKIFHDGAGGYWAAYVPGNSMQIYPAGFARKFPAGSTLQFQIHYTPNGKATNDQMRLGLVFAKEPPRFVVETGELPKPKLRIPPGEANHVEVAERVIPADVTAMAFMAHSHLRGKSFKFDLVKRDGTIETLLDIPRYDFNWQLRYDYAQPRLIPRGSTIRVTAVFDNSAGNPANPDPTQTVLWGPQTTNEMMIGYMEYFVPISPAKVASK